MQKGEGVRGAGGLNLCFTVVVVVVVIVWGIILGDMCERGSLFYCFCFTI